MITSCFIKSGNRRKSFQDVLFHTKIMYMLDVTVVGLLRGLQSRIYMINLEQTNQPHHHQVLTHHPNQVPRMQPHHQRCFKKSIVSDSRYVILQGTKTKTNFNSIPTDKVFNLPNIQWKEAS